MTLVDTTDSVLMLGAYGWAFVKPIRKLYYNLTITARLGARRLRDRRHRGARNLIGGQFGLDGGFWDIIGELNDIRPHRLRDRRRLRRSAGSSRR